MQAQLELGTIAYGDGGDSEAEGEWSHSFAALLEHEPLPEEPPPDPSEPAAIFFTSGSTGPAKGVTHTRESLRWMIASAAAAFELDDGRRLPARLLDVARRLLPLGAQHALGRRHVSSSPAPPTATSCCRCCASSSRRVLAMIPAALLALVRDHDLRPGDFAWLRICRAGSDKVSTELLTEFAAAAGFPIVEGYGMTEVGLATLNPPSGEIKQGSIGPPICGFSIALRDEDGEPIEGEAVGRIWIRTRSRMSGYWQAPEATAEVVLDELARLRRPRPRRRGRLPLVLRPQEAGDRPRRLQHQPARGRGRRWSSTRRSTWPASSASTTPSTARTCAPTSPCARAPSAPPAPT